jgi:uncharacterized YigZ family protein
MIVVTPYEIAANDIVDETIVSRSRFICYLYPCQSLEQMKEKLKALQVLHPQANHHCYAYLAGRANDSRYYGFSDDGEPSGTAGRPMLSALQGANIGEVCAIVVRYFGGTKLGTGGLQRAYGGSVRQALILLTSKTKIPMVHKTLTCQYSQVNDVLHLLAQIGGIVIEQDFTDNVQLTLAIPDEQLLIIQNQLQTLSSGQLLLKTLTSELI